MYNDNPTIKNIDESKQGDVFFKEQIANQAEDNHARNDSAAGVAEIWCFIWQDHKTRRQKTGPGSAMFAVNGLQITAADR